MSRPPAPVIAEYVIVGSGAGGGPLAVRLAQAGHSVVVIEAGGDADGLTYDVPAFHAYATEDERMRWDFFVRHYDDEDAQRRDDKYRPEQGGVLYPRAATVGGCTAHNAMITVYPNDQDWDSIADLCGDPSWRAEHMRTYFERLERCGHRWRPLTLLRSGWFGRAVTRLPIVRTWFAPSGHGFHGWLPTSMARPTLLAKDRQLVRTVVDAVEAQLAETFGRPLTATERLTTWFDPNDVMAQRSGMLGVWLIPLAVERGRRHGTREPLERAVRDHGLRILRNCLATRLVLDADGRCTGVEFRQGAHQYAADPQHLTAPAPGPAQVATATREVIVAGGSFNTPQLLMLSGIGPADELRAHGIDVRVDLPGVGDNLQDRYEVTVVTRMAHPFDLVTGGAFHPPRPDDPPDPYLAAWRKGKGAYTTNGGLLAVVARSRPELDVPDLFLFALPAQFRGYYPGYAEDLELQPDRLTWAILKAHTENRAGTVRLRSADPSDAPDIRFRYFDEGSDVDGRDLDAVVTGIGIARGLTRRLSRDGDAELFPGADVETEDAVRDYVRANAWGHHACGTCAIGPDDDPAAVLDSRFRVRSVPGLRVVDASVFPRIPGYFIVSAVYMASEKAADVILADAAGNGTAWPVRAGSDHVARHSA